LGITDELLGDAGFTCSRFTCNKDGLNSASGYVPECAVQGLEFRFAAEKSFLALQVLVIVPGHHFLLECLSRFHAA
jgi:hypothetical protein